MEFWKGSELERKKDTYLGDVTKGGKDEGKEPMAEGQWQERKQRATEKWQGRNQSMLDVWQDRPHCSVGVEKDATPFLYAIDEDDSENVGKEATDNEEDLQAWCLLEESENEQWQEVISKRDTNTRVKNRQSSVNIEWWRRVTIRTQRSKGQMGESQSHHGVWSSRGGM